jgi:hypothetical protein
VQRHELAVKLSQLVVFLFQKRQLQRLEVGNAESERKVLFDLLLVGAAAVLAFEEVYRAHNARHTVALFVLQPAQRLPRELEACCQRHYAFLHQREHTFSK